MLHDCLKSIVALTQQRDAKSLAVCLMHTLREFVVARDITLYAISNEHNDTEFNKFNVAGALVHDVLEDSRSTGQALQECTELLSCVVTQKSITEATDQKDHQRLILPVFGKHYVTNLVVIDQIKANDYDMELIKSLLKIFTNQQILLNRNELDALTGLLNRQSFDERLKTMLHSIGDSNRRSSTATYANRSCFAIIDVDYFKQVNDQYGHLYGDEVLLLLSQIMTRTFRHGDLLFRYGGEEFAVVLKDVDLNIALTALERLRKSVETFEFPQIGQKTVSAGVTMIRTNDVVSTLIDRADKALYYAKDSGRNRVCAFEVLLESGALENVEKKAGDIELF
jgi:diguanylate cyclase (GGDEF)-like protein